MKWFDIILGKIFSVASCGTTNKISRDLWLEKTISAIPRGSRILDAGAGELRYKNFCAHLDYVSQDFGKYDGQGDGAGLQTGKWNQFELDIVSDITSIPEQDASFDTIMCVEVFEHLPAPIEALKEFSRLLRSGGSLIITVPFCSLTHFAPYHFYSGFNRYFFEKWLAYYDFKLVEISPNGNFFEFVAQEIRRIDSVGKNHTCQEKKIGYLSSGIEKLALHILLKKLSRLSLIDKNSSELLCFGYHVLAKKVDM